MNILGILFPALNGSLRLPGFSPEAALPMLCLGTMGWIAAGSAVLGAGASIYGAKKSAKAQAEAATTNKAAVDETNRLNYQRWLESQGVGANGQPINTWLPRYAGVRRYASAPAGFRLGNAGARSFVAIPQSTTSAMPALPGSRPPVTVGAVKPVSYSELVASLNFPRRMST
jgi:hypothetical protein